MEEQQQLATMLTIETFSYLNKFPKSHPYRRLIADGLHKVRMKSLFSIIYNFIFSS